MSRVHVARSVLRLLYCAFHDAEADEVYFDSNLDTWVVVYRRAGGAIRVCYCYAAYYAIQDEDCTTNVNLEQAGRKLNAFFTRSD